jgi:hypothetical protein
LNENYKDYGLELDSIENEKLVLSKSSNWEKAVREWIITANPIG